MTARELDAAGITDPLLRDAYAHCRRLNARHGKTYFLATRLLPVERRPAVHALYGFARRADDLVDEPGAGRSTADCARALGALQRCLEEALRGERPRNRWCARSRTPLPCTASTTGTSRTSWHRCAAI